MDTSDEIPLEDHRFFIARLDYLKARSPASLLHHLESGTLTQHLRKVTCRAMRAKADLIINHQMPEDQANETVLDQIVADPNEQSRLTSPATRTKLRMFLAQYTANLPNLPRTYLSESETTE